MKLGQRIKSAASAFVAKSLSSFARSWSRGDDVGEGSSRQALVRPYEQSAWVYFALNRIVDEISGRPLKFYAGDTEHTDAALLTWWQAPALGPKVALGSRPRLSIEDTVRDLAAWAKLEGEFFVVLDDAWLLAGASRNPAALSPFLIASPTRMQVIVNGDQLAGWRYTDVGGRQSIFVPEQVIHWKAFNPYDDWRGQGALAPARIAADTAFSTGVYIRDLMRNNGDPGFIVIGKSGVVDDKQREQIAADLRSKRLALSRGVARDLFLTGDITVDRPKEQAASSDLTAGKALSHQEILVAFGVPPSFAEVKASYSVGKDSDYYQLIIATCMPLGGKIAGSFAKIASRQTGKALTAEFDWDDHPVMVEVRNGRITSLKDLWAMGMPVKAANEYLDLGIKPFAGWEIGYLPFSVAPVGEGLPEQSPASAEPVSPTNNEEPPREEDDAVRALRLALLARQRSLTRPAPVCRAVATDEWAVFACNHGGSGVAQRADRPAKDIARWRTYMTQRRETLKSYESRFNRWLMQARSETLANLQREASKSYAEKGWAPDYVFKAPAGQILFNLAKATADLLSSFAKAAELGLDASGQQLMQELEREDPWKLPPEKVVEFIAAREKKLAGVPDEVWQRIKASYEQGVADGDSTEKLADRIRAEFNEISKTRARMIASTETGAVYGSGRHEAIKAVGGLGKAWLTSGNDSVRPSHQQAGLDYPPERAIPVDEPFFVGNAELQHPGDSSGPAEEVIQCHCVELASELLPTE